MTIQLADQSVLRAIRCLFHAPVGRAKRAAIQPSAADIAALLEEVRALGERLNNAIELEQEFNKIDLMQASADVVEQWRQCRRTVDLLGQAYTRILCQLA